MEQIPLARLVLFYMVAWHVMRPQKKKMHHVDLGVSDFFIITIHVWTTMAL